ncbi:MAG: CPBP family intramembrane metalloprotease [Deinococcota bacterium]|jgi:membrane protease YdiL (CAAX protease family)|nr:CPBP family intramembrane metalloprotease [Deinococcota bacterium]
MKAALSPLLLLLSDVFLLFRGRQARLSWLLLAMLLLQAAYWYLGSPGPELLAGAPRSLAAALGNIGWAALFFLLVPLVLLRLVGMSSRDAFLQVGDARFGLQATALMSMIAVPVLWFAAQDAALQASYPWAGSWPGQSALTFLAWAGLYGLYYLAYEFFFRGFMLRVLEPHWGLSAAIWVQALTSALIHLGKPPLETLGAIPLGLVFAALAVRTRSILWPALFHLVVGLLTDAFSLHHQGLLLPAGWLP